MTAYYVAGAFLFAWGIAGAVLFQVRGFVLGVLLGPVGFAIAWWLSSRDRQAERLYQERRLRTQREHERAVRKSTRPIRWVD